jgi:AcrR family transcriptional regulator
VTRDRILAASAHEIEVYGISQFRVKRVASEFGGSVALLYTYFRDREELIAATIVHLFRDVILSQAETFLRPLRDVTSRSELVAALEQMITDAQEPARDIQRLVRIDGMSFAHHNQFAAEGIEAAKAEASEKISEVVSQLGERGLLSEGVSPIAFARVWYALFFGQISLEGQHALSIAQDEWKNALRTIALAMVRSE